MPTKITAPLVLALALAACGDDAATAPPRDETPPALEILAPTPADSVLLARPILVRARCQEDDGRECSVEVYLQGRLVAYGTDSVNTVVSLAEHVDRSVRFDFVAVNRSGGRTTAESGQLRIVSSRWTEVVKLTVPGRLLDADPERVVYVTGDFVRVRTVATGAEQEVFAESSARNTTARLFPGGVLLSLNGGDRKPNGMREIGGSGASSGVGFNEQVRGRWVSWGTYFADELYVDDVLTPRLIRVPNWGMLLAGHDVTDDGTLVYAVIPRGIPAAKGQVFRVRGGVTEALTDTASDAYGPASDGTNVVFTRRTSTPDGYRYQLVLLAPGGETALGPAGPAPSRYDAEAGWVVFTLPNDAGVAQLWTRSPAGELRRVTSWTTPGTLVSLGLSGQLLVENGGRWHFAPTPGAPFVDVGPARSRVAIRWFLGDERLYVLSGDGLLRLDL
jgi:hypothetical protein